MTDFAVEPELARNLRSIPNTRGYAVLEEIEEKEEVEKEFLVDNEWVPEPAGQPGGIRYKFENPDDARAAYEATQLLTARQRAPPQNWQRVAEGIVAGATDGVMTLAYPYNVPPETGRTLDSTSPAGTTLDVLDQYLQELSAAGVDAELIIYTLDPYSENMGFDRSLFDDFYSELVDGVARRDGCMEVVRWPTFEQRYLDGYTQKKDEVRASVDQYVSAELVDQARNRAAAMGVDPENGEEYLAMRIAEDRTMESAIDVRLSPGVPEDDVTDTEEAILYVAGVGKPWSCKIY
ncbi:MAG: hypothetical protein SV186_02010 [Candidatus Nanohaloarchaea archaeon]|nr:hypothetical protein [Candidatus Nanohaloarchaea archaeon]